MTPEEIQQMKAILETQPPNRRGPSPGVSVLIGLSIAILGNFIGWFANKSTGDIANVTKITQSIEFMRNDLNELKSDFKQRDEDINAKLDKSFTRDEFEREMIYRDSDIGRLKAQIDALHLEIDKH